MDIYNNSYAQRRNAQDMITANAMAEAEERERLAAKLTGYEGLLQEIRKCSLQNLENAEKVKELTATAIQRMGETQKKEEAPEMKEAVEEIKKLLEEQRVREQEYAESRAAQVAEIRDLMEGQKQQVKEELEGFMKQQEEKMQSLEDFTHKESVKVYRNVQAVLEENTAKQTKEIATFTTGSETSGALVAVWIVTLIAALANVGIAVAQYFGLL